MSTEQMITWCHLDTGSECQRSIELIAPPHTLVGARSNASVRSEFNGALSKAANVRAKLYRFPQMNIVPNFQAQNLQDVERSTVTSTRAADLCQMVLHESECLYMKYDWLISPTAL